MMTYYANKGLKKIGKKLVDFVKFVRVKHVYNKILH